MQQATIVTHDVILLGAGHAHVEVLRRAAMRPIAGVRFTLIAREANTPYSGMLPSLLRGEADFAAAHIDCARLAAAAGARLVVAAADNIDLATRRVGFADRPAMGFDVLSINIGGLPVMPPGAWVPVKPIGQFLARLAQLEANLPPGARIAMVGAGAAGVELSLALAARFAGRFRLALVGRDAEPLAQAPRALRDEVRAALVAAGIEVLNGVSATRLDGNTLALSDGSAIEVGAAIWAAGVAGPALLRASGLVVDANACARVDATLTCLGQHGIFAAGDCAALDGAPRPKAGVWAVRAGVVLDTNIRRLVAGKALRSWHPQRGALAIIGLGQHRAVAWRGPFTLSGNLAWRWKTCIDRRWIAMYQALRPMMAATDMRCAGCGAKISAETLSDAIAGLAEPPRDDIPVGLSAADDAAVTLPPAGMALVQSVDYFRAFIDDPYVFGAIAAAHALSDIHAMGAKPWTALAIVALPFMHGRAMGEDLRAMMLGAHQVLKADGCALIGGHSAEGAEAALGFAITGVAPIGQIWRKSGLRAGDALVLTKPLGTGIILAGQMRGLAQADWLLAAIASMRRTNRDAAGIFRAHDVAACTDITGFGLIGHVMEILAASGVQAVINPDLVPALPGALELAALGVESSLALANRGAHDLPATPRAALLVDPQTSGGLLAGVAAARAEACVAALRAVGHEAAIIGQVTPGSGLRLG
jgi:selenide,water dikinase